MSFTLIWNVAFLVTFCYLIAVLAMTIYDEHKYHAWQQSTVWFLFEFLRNAFVVIPVIAFFALLKLAKSILNWFEA